MDKARVVSLVIALSACYLLVEALPHRKANSQDFPNNYVNVSKAIIDYAFQNTNLSGMAYMCDTFGPRYRGTPGLENALAWIVETMEAQGLDNVRTEPVDGITNWVRGTEYLTMHQPRKHQMAILGLGNSVGTGGSPLIGEVFVVSSFDELTANATQAKGKIVLFDAPFVTYGQTVAYRVNGASAAAKVGAIAALVRSITPFSLYTPHTGVMRYQDNLPKIPTAAVTIEDAELMHRMQNRGQKIIVELNMEAQTAPTVTHYNILAEIQGSQYPEEVVVLGGHSDSWDVGTGCMDDGGGLYSSWDSLRILHDLIMQGVIPRPKRTIRVVLWVDEEISGRGAQVYYQDHVNELNNHVMAMESDSGNFVPTGFGFSGSKSAFSIISDIGNVLLAPIGAGNITFGNGADADNGILVQNGVPGGSLTSRGFEIMGKPAYYFYFHHTNADTFTAIDAHGMKASVAAFGIMSYVVADMDQTLPRD